MKVYAWVNELTAVGHHRIVLPFKYLNELGFGEFGHNTYLHDPTKAQLKRLNKNEQNVKFMEKSFTGKQLLVFSRLDHAHYVANMAAARDGFKVPVIVDNDDAVQEVRPWSPAYQGYAPQNERNHWHKRLIQTADAITVSTKDLKDYYVAKGYKKKGDIYVLPNSLDLNDWQFETKAHDEIRIGWAGSSAHYESLKMIERPLEEIMAKNPHVKLVVTRAFPEMFERIPKKQLILVPFAKYATWPKTLAEDYALDVALYPLTDHLFNRAKSNLRYLQYSALKWPTVGSPVSPLKCIQHGQTGFLARNNEEWIKYVQKLIDNPDLRKKMGQAAYDYVAENFDQKLTAHLWAEAYQDVINKTAKTKALGKFKPSF